MSERRSRWDKSVPAASATAPLAAGEAVSSDEAKKKALEAVARLNLLFTPTVAAEAAKPAESTDDVTVERMGINHLPAPKRFQLTKKATVDECRDRFGVFVSPKGVYQPPDAPPDNANEPIYLELRGPSLSTVNACLKYLKDLLLSEDSAPSHSGKVFVPIPAKSPFNVVAKIVGPSGEFVKHIKKQANCQVQIVGRDCGIKAFENDEELHIRLDAHSAEGLVKAKQLTQDLIDHVVQQYQEWVVSLPPNLRPPPLNIPGQAPAVPSPAATRPPPPPVSAPPPPPPPAARPQQQPPPPPASRPPPPPPPPPVPSSEEPESKRARH